MTLDDIGPEWVVIGRKSPADYWWQYSLSDWQDLRYWRERGLVDTAQKRDAEGTGFLLLARKNSVRAREGYMRRMG